MYGEPASRSSHPSGRKHDQIPIVKWNQNFRQVKDKEKKKFVTIDILTHFDVVIKGYDKKSMSLSKYLKMTGFRLRSFSLKQVLDIYGFKRSVDIELYTEESEVIKKIYYVEPKKIRKVMDDMSAISKGKKTEDGYAYYTLFQAGERRLYRSQDKEPKVVVINDRVINDYADINKDIPYQVLRTHMMVYIYIIDSMIMTEKMIQLKKGSVQIGDIWANRMMMRLSGGRRVAYLKFENRKRNEFSLIDKDLSEYEIRQYMEYEQSQIPFVHFVKYWHMLGNRGQEQYMLFSYKEVKQILIAALRSGTDFLTVVQTMYEQYEFFDVSDFQFKMKESARMFEEYIDCSIEAFDSREIVTVKYIVPRPVFVRREYILYLNSAKEDNPNALYDRWSQRGGRYLSPESVDLHIMIVGYKGKIVIRIGEVIRNLVIDCNIILKYKVRISQFYNEDYSFSNNKNPKKELLMKIEKFNDSGRFVVFVKNSMFRMMSGGGWSGTHSPSAHTYYTCELCKENRVIEEAKGIEYRKIMMRNRTDFNKILVKKDVKFKLIFKDHPHPYFYQCAAFFLNRYKFQKDIHEEKGNVTVSMDALNHEIADFMDWLKMNRRVFQIVDMYYSFVGKDVEGQIPVD